MIGLFFLSCEKEYSYQNGQQAKGSLKSSTTGDCLPSRVIGTLNAGKNLADSNQIEITVDVSQTGSYNIHTDTVNGYYFSSSGDLGATGLNKVTLKGAGKPIAGGTNHFKVQFNTSICYLDVTVVAPLSLAAFTLHGSPGTCMNDTVWGSYVNGIALTDSNKLSIELNVSTAGTYTVNTDTVNGYSFAGSGVLNNTGIQTIVLKATGTPLKTGADVFTVKAGNSTCSFSNNVVTAVATTGTDYFPLGFNDRWVYGDLMHQGDSIVRVRNDSVLLNGVRYNIVQEQQRFGAPLQFFYRKADSLYYENTSVDKYTTSVTFVPEIRKDILFLKENLVTGASWSSDEYIGPSSFSQVIFIRYDFYCTDADAVVTINGKTFAHVYKILMMPKIRSAVTYPYNSTGEKTYIYYAKGIGIIYSKTRVTGSFVFTTAERQINNWTVN
jgi:hypothetical protein